MQVSQHKNYHQGLEILTRIQSTFDRCTILYMPGQGQFHDQVRTDCEYEVSLVTCAWTKLDAE